MHQFRPLRYSINVTLDGCCHHMSVTPDEELHRRAAASVAGAGALIFGRVTYGMMEEAWRPMAETGKRPESMPAWTEPFARGIHAARKYVVSDTLEHADWNAKIIRGDQLEATVRALKQQSGEYLFTGGIKLPLALAELGLIDEYEFVVHPRVAGYGPTLFAGLSKPLDLRMVSEQPYGSGAVARRYVPRV